MHFIAEKEEAEDGEGEREGTGRQDCAVILMIQFGNNDDDDDGFACRFV